MTKEQRPVCSKCQTPMVRYNVTHTGDREQAWRLACSCKHSAVSEVVPSKTDLIQYLWVCVDLAGQKGGDGLAYVSPVELRRAIELLGAVETTVHDIPLQKPCVEWPDVAAAIHALYDEPREGHRGCGEIALAAAKEIERLRPAEEPSPPHPGPSIEKAFTNSPRRVEPTRRIPPREFDIESHTGLYTEPAARKATYRDIYPNDPTWWKEGMTSPWFELPSTLPEKASDECQHDLLLPNTTISVDPADPFRAWCTVCKHDFRTRAPLKDAAPFGVCVRCKQPITSFHNINGCPSLGRDEADDATEESMRDSER